ncbi:MAG: ABC transporter substrate-binding protein [Gemmatimonadales bacterium]
MRPLALACALVWIAACGGDAGPIRVGVAGPFSQPRGVAMKQAAQLAEREINGRGGIGGRPLELVFADDSARDSVAVRVAQTLREDPSIVAVIGHLTSAASIAAVRVYGGGADPVVLVSPSASSPDLSGISPYFFRVCPSDLSHGPRLARLARQTFAARTAGVIYVNDDYGRGIRRTFVTEFARIGGTVRAEDPALPTTPSLEPYLSRMRGGGGGGGGGGVDVLVLAVEARMAELALREMARLGIRWPVVGGDALAGVEHGGPLAEGVRVATAYLPDRPGARNQAFVEAYVRAYPGQLPDHRGAGAYDIVHLLAQAIGAAGTDRAAIRDYVASVGAGRAPFEGVTGTIAFDAQGDVPAKTVVIGVVREGRLVTESAQ